MLIISLVRLAKVVQVVGILHGGVEGGVVVVLEVGRAFELEPALGVVLSRAPLQD